MHSVWKSEDRFETARAVAFELKFQAPAPESFWLQHVSVWLLLQNHVQMYHTFY